MAGLDDLGKRWLRGRRYDGIFDMPTYPRAVVGRHLRLRRKTWFN